MVLTPFLGDSLPDGAKTAPLGNPQTSDVTSRSPLESLSMLVDPRPVIPVFSADLYGVMPHRGLMVLHMSWQH